MDESSVTYCHNGSVMETGEFVHKFWPIAQHHHRKNGRCFKTNTASGKIGKYNKPLWITSCGQIFSWAEYFLGVYVYYLSILTKICPNMELPPLHTSSKSYSFDKNSKNYFSSSSLKKFSPTKYFFIPLKFLILFIEPFWIGFIIHTKVLKLLNF